MGRLDEYVKTPVMNQSLLKLLLISPKAFKFGSSQEESSSLIRGSALDILVTQGEEAFKNAFYVAKITAPTGKYKLFVDKLFVLSGGEVDERFYEEAYHHADWKREGLQKVIDTFKDKYFEYYKERVKNIGKIGLSDEDWSNTYDMANTILTDPFCSQYFKNADFQVPIYGKLLDIDCKALLDIVIETEDTVQPIDIKTTGFNVFDFERSYRKFRYDIQASFYTEILKTKYPDKKILPFKFLVVETALYNPPLVYEVSEEELQFGRLGGVSNGIKYRGWEDLLKEYSQRMVTQDWEYPLNYAEHGKTIIMSKSE